MSSHKTEKYKLHTWEPGDDFLRSEFNTNFAALDASVRMVTGVYTGDGEAQRVIDLGLTPLAVLLVTQDGVIRSGSNTSYTYGGLALPQRPARTPDNKPAVEIVENGFRVGSRLQGNYIWTNWGADTYHYIAFY